MLPCVVLGGGAGMRMRPMTEHVPKPLIQVQGRPFVELQLEWLAGEGVREVVYSIGYRGDMIRDRIGDGARFGVRVKYVDEGEQLRGSGGALRWALDQGALPRTFFLLYGDAYLSVDLDAVERRWRELQLPVLMTIMRNDDRWDRSNADFRDGRVIYDKKRAVAHRMRWIDYGLSVMESSVIRRSLPQGATGDVADVLHGLSRAGRVGGFEVIDRFYEIGSPDGLRDLERHLSQSRPSIAPA